MIGAVQRAHYVNDCAEMNLIPLFNFKLLDTTHYDFGADLNQQGENNICLNSVS